MQRGPGPWKVVWLYHTPRAYLNEGLLVQVSFPAPKGGRMACARPQRSRSRELRGKKDYTESRKNSFTRCLCFDVWCCMSCVKNSFTLDAERLASFVSGTTGPTEARQARQEEETLRQCLANISGRLKTDESN